MIGLFGGTFDPIHFGHLRPALEVFNALPFRELRFLPCGVPGHRTRPIASPLQRLTMVRAAIGDTPGFKLDSREVDKPTPCYSVETLLELRAEMPTHPLALVIGMDAFLGLESWHRWREVIALAHIVVTHRPGWDEERIQDNPVLSQLVAEHQCWQVEELTARPAGGIWFQPVTLLDISATRIRQMLKAGEEVRFLLPESVNQLLKQQRIYA